VKGTPEDKPGQARRGGITRLLFRREARETDRLSNALRKLRRGKKTSLKRRKPIETFIRVLGGTYDQGTLFEEKTKPSSTVRRRRKRSFIASFGFSQIHYWKKSDERTGGPRIEDCVAKRLGGGGKQSKTAPSLGGEVRKTRLRR